MAKKLAVCLAALLLLLSLTACSAQENSPEDETDLSIAASFSSETPSTDAPTQSEQAVQTSAQ